MNVTQTSPALGYDVVGNGPPVLMVMGFAMPGEAWRPQLERLSGDCRVAYFDNRGVGKSARIETAHRGPWTMADLADDAIRVADAAGFDSFHLVGVSMGGMIAQHVALRTPARVRSLSLLVTHAGGPRAALPTARGAACIVGAELLPKLRPRFMKSLLYSNAVDRRVPAGAVEARLRSVNQTKPAREALLWQLSAVRGHDTRRVLHRIGQPTLVVGATHDRLCRPRQARDLAQRITGSSYVELDAGHGANFERAAELTSLLWHHIRSSERQGSGAD